MTGLARRLLGKKACLCTTAKRDSFYEDSTVAITRTNDRQSTTDQYGFVQSDKPRRLLMRQASLDESDGDDDTTNSITERLRRANVHSPANIPMLVVVSFNPDVKGLQKQQIEIQRGFPVNAQYILNEWLFIKTADNEEGFVPYLCCRPMFRRQSTRHIDNSYKLHDFESNRISSQRKSSSTFNKPILTPPTNKKLSLSTNFASPFKKRQDVTSSSCGGDSGVSDCESSSNNHQSFDMSNNRRSAHLSQIRSLRSSSATVKKTGLIVQDLPLKNKIMKTNQMKSQLLISSNSAFTQIVKKNQQSQGIQRKSFHHEPNMSAFKSSNHRLYESYDETSKYLASDNTNLISSPYIRRTPYARRSLPQHISKPLHSKSSSSPDPFKIVKEQQLRNIVLAEPSLPPAIIPKKSSLERHFSDLSLNQIENDSLSPVQNRPCLSCSSSTPLSSSSSDGHTTPFIHIQMNNYRTGRIPVVYASSNLNQINSTNTPPQTTKSNSFIHNVSITV